MRILVTGVTGFVGGRLAARLAGEGEQVRGFARSPARAERAGVTVPVTAGDAITGEGLTAALRDIEVAYYLIHSMESGAGSGSGGFGARERMAAQRFAAAAREAGVRRIVYLGGPVPPGPLSPHLRSRHEVERILLEAVPDSVALRASIVIGAGSRSFRFLVRLVERLPLLPVPAWGTNLTAPVDERDILTMLARAGAATLGPARAGHVLEAAGPDVVSYRGLIERIAELLLISRPSVGLPWITLTPVASRVAASVAGEDVGLIEPLMESLSRDLLPRGELAASTLRVRLHSLDAAVEHALSVWERSEPLAAR